MKQYVAISNDIKHNLTMPHNTNQYLEIPNNTYQSLIVSDNVEMFLKHPEILLKYHKEKTLNNPETL